MLLLGCLNPYESSLPAGGPMSRDWKLKFSKPGEGKWVQPVMNGYLMKCCDCGLVHRLNFRIVRGIRNGKYIDRVQFQVFRHDSSRKVR